MTSKRKNLVVALALASVGVLSPCSGLSLSSFSSFHGTSMQPLVATTPARQTTFGAASLTMRKQKASDKRTRRMQRGSEDITQEAILASLRQTITSSPMDLAEWNYKKKGVTPIKEKTGGRGRSRKRATLYNSLSSYHSKFLKLLTAEYKAEVRYSWSFGIGYLKNSLDLRFVLRIFQKDSARIEKIQMLNVYIFKP